MKNKKIMAVFGYNNSRIYDVMKIKTLVKEKHDAEILLVKEAINLQDREVTPYCLDYAPEDPQVIDSLLSYLKENNLDLIGCLPFSDKGVIGASHVSAKLGLFGDDPLSSYAMLDKKLFRELEAEIDLSDSVYKKPFFYTLHSEDEIFNLLSRKGPFFIKPTAEGNSRGCMKIESSNDIKHWLKENSSSLKQGAICEELLGNNNEFSFDGVAGHYWITEKFTTSGSYRAEYQQIVPAPFSESKNIQLYETLEPLLSQLGSRGGAFHHEFFLMQDDRIASVEPNRRPAGMWIWDLATWAFEAIDPWSCWIDRCANIQSDKTVLKKKFFAGVRGVISNKNGRLTNLNKEKIKNQLDKNFGAENLRISFLKENESSVRSIPRDNSDFLAFIALRDPNYQALCKNLDLAQNIFLENLEVGP